MSGQCELVSFNQVTRAAGGGKHIGLCSFNCVRYFRARWLFSFRPHLPKTSDSLNHFIRLLFTGDFRLFHLRGFGFFGGAGQVQREQVFEDLFVREIGRPAIGGGDGGIQFLVRQIEPGGALVVKVREGALFQFGGALGIARFKARISQEQVVGIARQVAIEHKERLEDYWPAKAEFDADTGKWIVVFGRKNLPVRERPDTYHTFGIRVDDKTGYAEYKEGMLK